MRMVTVAATQFACSWDRAANIAAAEALVREAAGRGAQVILLQELFETPYFCIEQDPRHLALATTRDANPAIAAMRSLARELGVVLPVSWFERSGQALFNACAVIDADGAVLGTYRKSHIPNGPGYQEKQYFTPGDTGFRVWETAFGRIGIGVCWDQWFPEAARCMALAGAELLLYPTAIGSEPTDPGLDSRAHWRTVMCGHAGANIVPVIASNRIGAESGRYTPIELRFYGTSFVADHTGAVVAQADDRTPGALTHAFDLDAIAAYRAAWGVWRDRRPELYGAILTHGG
jgi:N-carbamoylputrescine amidase